MDIRGNIEKIDGGGMIPRVPNICDEVFDADPEDLDIDGCGWDPFEGDAGGD